MSKKKEKINRSVQFRNGSYSSILTIVVIAIVIVVNLAVNALPAEYTTFDTSGVDYYSVTDTTKNMLKKLDKNINIYLLSDTSGSYNEYIETICSIYKDNSDKISFKKIDVAVNPSFAAQYNASGAESYSVIVEEPDSGKYRVIDFSDIYYSKTSYDESGTSYYTYYYDGEGQISSAINYVTSEKSVMIYEMGGHGEQTLSSYGADEAFEKNNYTLASEQLDLTSGDGIPEDCDVLFLFAPTVDYSSAETELIKEYIAGGGNVIIIYNNVIIQNGAVYASTTEMTNFYSIMKYVGVSVTEGLIIEQDSKHYYGAGSNPQYTLMPDKMSNSTVFSDIEDSYILTLFASPVKQEEPDECTSVYAELLTTSSDYQVVYLDDQYTVDYTEPASIATYIESTFEESGNTSNTLVVGCSLFLYDFTADETLVNNNIKFISNTIKEMVGDTDSVYIEPKSLEEKFNVTTQSQVNLFTIVYLGLIPLAFLLGGISVWILRRAK